MAIALNHLRGDGRGGKAEPAADVGFDRGVEVGERADGAGDLADGDGGTRLSHAAEVATELVVPQRQLEAERHRLGVHAVRAADHRGAAMLVRPRLHRVAQRAEQRQDEVGRLDHLQCLRRVDDVGRGEPEVQPARRWADVFGHRRGEGDHVVLRRLLDLFDAVDVERGPLAQLTGGIGGHEAHGRHGVGRGQFHGQPGLVAALFGPDAPHLGVGVTADHASASCSARTTGASPPPSTVRPRAPAGNSRWATRVMSSSVMRSMAASMSSSDSSVSP